jgi:SAM-dependent MidA family methyltransferase
VLVERSASLRHTQGALVPLEPVERALGPAVRPSAHDEPIPVTGVGPLATALDDLPAFTFDGVVIANELLDNLPFDLVERAADGWLEVRVGLDGDRLVEVLVVAPPELAVEADRVAAGVPVPVGTRLPVPTGAAAWLEACTEVLHRGFVAVVDYAAGVEDLVERGPEGWLRTYRGHERGGPPLADVGRQDVTCDVPLEYVRALAERRDLRLVLEARQADWLRSLGLEELVEEARAAWDAGAATGDLAAVAARSRVHEADALTDERGLGAHRVFVLAKGLAPGDLD